MDVMKNKKFVRFTVICLVVLMLASTLAGCGSKKEKNVDGYYICKADNDIFALEIHGDTATLRRDRTGSSTIEGIVEITDEGADIYLEKSSSRKLNEWIEFNPFHLKLSGDGERMYFSSDKDGWITDIYQVVNKKEFEEIIDGF